MSVVGIVGLGYVGLPLALAFGKKMETIGFDLDENKISNYQNNIDPSAEIESQDFIEANQITYVTSPESLARADFIIICVPTPITDANRPDMTLLRDASRLVATHMKQGATLIYESTVYPGATEEVCIPVLEEVSKMEWRKEFFVGYSPERINPGDKEHTLENVIKIVSGDSEETCSKVADLYSTVVKAGVHQVSTIQAAEAAKVIENTQRDLNIALINELSIIFNKMKIDTNEVMEAAATKWNFLKFAPGLVGGHCLGVDPYYLTHKAERLGYHPEIILAGRRINDNMGKYIAEQIIKTMLAADVHVLKAKVNILGLTYKENCKDLRNSKVFDVIEELEAFNIQVNLHDPHADPHQIYNSHGVEVSTWEDLEPANALVLAVPHQYYEEKSLNALLSKIKPRGVLIDLKHKVDKMRVLEQGIQYWSL